VSLPMWAMAANGSTPSVGKGSPLRLHWLPVVRASHELHFVIVMLMFFICRSYFGAPYFNSLRLAWSWYCGCWSLGAGLVSCTSFLAPWGQALGGLCRTVRCKLTWTFCLVAHNEFSCISGVTLA
jgi:hypothetical protein